MGVVVSLVFGTVLLSFFAVFAIVTNGSDRLYGGPFTTIAYSLGNQVAIIACAMFCLANCAFTGLNLTACTHLIQRYVIQHNSIQPNLPKLALENNRDAIDELCDRSYSMHFILFIAFLTFITILNCFEKGIIKCKFTFVKRIEI
ncbi:unnamed protein product [Thelazia callipaeda]|uniref:Aa_trans domain-containing protein n=1 Tax=Thelazia callipaeda TaxID=103827 RepID=A0A0N5CKP6_THECL|nr:unnamed protein product [Thelazia callipaeda]